MDQHQHTARPSEPADATSTIRRLNDALRITGLGGRLVMTRGVASLPDDQRQQIIGAVRAFAAFDTDNDPYGEHDCATVTVGDQRVIWKIDYYDRAMAAHSPDPTDPGVTVRILTIMLAEEY